MPRREPLPIDEEVVIGKKLLTILVKVLSTYPGGLVSKKDLETLEPHMKIEFVNREASKSPKSTPRATYYPVWRQVCGCCGSSWVVEWLPSPASNAPASAPGTMPEKLGQPKPAAYFMTPWPQPYAVLDWPAMPAAARASKPIAVERAAFLLPAEAQRKHMAVVGVGAAQPAPAAAARSWELRFLGDDELVDDYPKDAQVCYTQGRAAYLRRDYGAARAYLTHAIKLNDGDARFWYFKALAELAMDRRDLASASAQRGKNLEGRGLPAGESIRLSLRGVPAAARQFLATLRAPAVAQPLASAR